MDNIIQLLYSRISHSNKNIVYLEKPPPTLYSLLSKYQRTHNQVWNNYNELIEQANLQIKRRIINVTKIKQIGSQIYEWLTNDISRLIKNQQHVDRLQILQNSLQVCQQKQLKYIGLLKQSYQKIKAKEYKNEEQANFQQFIKLHFAPYVKKVLQQIMPTYQYIIQQSQINKIINKKDENTNVMQKQSYEQQTQKLRQILSKVRSIVASEYQKWLQDASPRSTQHMQGAINFLVRLKNILAEVDIFICGQNCALQKTYFYAQYNSVRLLNIVKCSYHKFIRNSIHKKWSLQYYPNVGCMNGFLCQCYYQIALHIYMQKFSITDVDTIEQSFNNCLTNMNNLLFFNDSTQKIKMQQKLQQMKKKVQWYQTLISSGICNIFNQVKSKLDVKLIQLQQLNLKCKGLAIFYLINFQKCLAIFKQANKIIKSNNKNQIINLNQCFIKLNQHMVALQTILAQLKKGYFGQNIIVDSINLKVNEIKQQKNKIAIRIIQNQSQESRNSGNQNLLAIFNRVEKSKYLKPIQIQTKNLPKLELQQVQLILQDCELYFQVQFKSYLANGLDLALYQLDQGNLMSKKHQNQGKYIKAQSYMQNLMKKLNFDKTIFNGPKLKRRQSSRSIVKSQDLDDQLGGSKISLSLNRSQLIQMDMKRQTDIATTNIKVLLHLLQLDLRDSKGGSIVKLAEQCLDFEVQDWTKRIINFQTQFTVFKRKVKQLHIITNTNVTYLFSSVYKILKQHSSVLQITDDILTEILFIFKTCKQMENQRKGNFIQKHINIVDAKDLSYLQTILSYKLKMKEEFQQLQKFNNISKNSKNYLVEIYSRFNVSFQCCYPYKQQILSNILQRMQCAIGFKQNNKQIFETFIRKLQQLSSTSGNRNNEQINDICRQIQNLQNEVKAIIKLGQMKLPIEQSGLDEINRIYLLHSDQFMIAKILCTSNQQVKVPKLSSERKSQLLNKIIRESKMVKQK